MVAVSTRAAILAAAEEWFAERGFAGSRLVDITGQAGVTTGALYRYFPGKGALFDELLDGFEQASVAKVTAASGFVEACAGWLTTATRHAGTLRVVFEIARPGTEVADRLRKLRRRTATAFAEHVPGTVEDRMAAARVVTDLLFHYGLSASSGWVQKRSARKVAAALGRLVERGLYADGETVPPDATETIAARRHAPRPAFEPYIRWQPAAGKEQPRYARGQRTWEAVRVAAIDVFGERGLTDATALDVARAAGVSSGTVYRYFVDKEDIFRSLQASAEADIARDTHLPLEHGRLAIRQMLLAYFDVYRRHIALFRAWQELLQRRAEMAQAWVGMRRRFVETATRAIRFGQRVGIADPGADAAVVAELHSICYEAVTYSRLILGWDIETSDDDVATTVERLFIGGFGR